ncbi:4Fe-4S binding protein [Nonomuraea sp. NPDC049784]|uniref:4Fe-4S binding protein n=1 Tax=Nonomuraea sp. NPDC049784 TaxID=3154361 RepID=UPI00340B8F7C
MLCARECPDWCIYIDSHKETIPAPEGGRPRQRNVLDRFAIDFSLCMYCGICIEVCPFDALFWSPEFEYAEGDIRNLIHEKDKLAAWTQTVPPPPAHDPGAEPPKELTAAPRRPAAARTPGAAKPTQAPPSGTADRPSTRTPRPTTSTREPEPTPEAEERESATASPETQGATGTAGTQPTPDTGGPTAGTGETMPKAGPSPAETAAQDAGPAADAPEPGPATPSGPQGGRGRPRRPMQNVRGIRPPGALPSSSEHETPTSSAEGRPPSRSASPGEPTPSPSAEQPPPGTASSTDQPSPEKLSTASGAAQPEPEPEQQTSATSPRRRRMADPRSIRPPGRLGPDETGESEEES